MLDDGEIIVTDAHVWLGVYSSELTVDQLIEAVGFKPTSTGVKGSQRTPRSMPLPANCVFLHTEELNTSKDLNDHIELLRACLPDGNFADRFNPEIVTVRCTVYWWTTAAMHFSLSPSSLKTLSDIGVPVYFNVVVYPSSVP